MAISRNARAGLLARVVGALLRAFAKLFSLLAPRLLRGIGSLARHLLAALHRLLARLLGLLLDVVGDRADLLVLDLGRGHEESGHEANRGRTDGEAERVLLCHPGCALGAFLYLAAV